jgi:hypothetical protein
MLRIFDLSSLHRHHWSFLLRRRQTPAIPLPVELWEQILNYVLYVPFLLDTTFVRPQDFCLFIESCLIGQQPYAYTQSKDERKRLRLVCRSWNAILSRTSERWVILSSLPNGLSIPKGAKRVDIGGGCLVGNAEKIPWENAYSTSILAYRNQTGRDLSVLFEKAANLQAVRSFVYHVNQGPLPLSVLRNLETYFGNLTTLIFTCFELSGTLHLPNLTTLYLGFRSASTDIKKWWFPSLRHIAFGEESIIGMYDPQSHRPFIPGPMEKLQSLLLLHRFRRSAFLEANHTFWTSHPSLQFLGISSQSFMLRSDPLSDHPLSHIHFLEAHFILDFTTVTDAAFRIPNLQTITIQDEMDIGQGYVLRRKWPDVYDTCRRLGIRWFNKRGEELHSKLGRRKGGQEWKMTSS